MSNVSPIPGGFNSVSAYLVVEDAKAAIDFYIKAFDAKAGTCLTAPDGNILHAEVQIGNSTVMLSGENPEWGMQTAKTLGGSPISMHIYCDDCDKLFEQAVAAGCTPTVPVTDMFWGDRLGKVQDPSGIQWAIATHTEDMSEEEMDKRAKEWMAAMQASEAQS